MRNQLQKAISQLDAIKSAIEQYNTVTRLDNSEEAAQTAKNALITSIVAVQEDLCKTLKARGISPENVKSFMTHIYDGNNSTRYVRICVYLDYYYDHP